MLNVLAYVHLRRIVKSTGAGRAARCLTENLAACGGTDVRVLGDSGDYQRIAPEAGPSWTGLKHYLFPRDTSSQQARWLFLARPTAEAWWPDVQVTLCTSESYVPVKRSRLVVTLNDAAHLEPQAHRRGLSILKQRMKWNCLYRVLERKADLLHTASTFSAERLAHFWPGMRDRLRVVPHGTPQRFFEPPSQEALDSVRVLGLEPRQFVLLPCGLDHRKNGDLVLSAWKTIRELLPGLKLIVTSNASDPSYLERAKAHGDSIVIPGHVTDDVMCALYHSAAVVWFPSRYEGFGLPILEAMACGAPVISSNCTSIPEVAGDCALLLPTDDTGAHIDAIRSFVTSSAVADQWRVKGPDRARQYTWANSARKMRTLLEALV
ncbi:MAG TPA: glycosyltransferase family 1 protein [Bryobacteraceae bacterium]|nr:glycosyltransferase family 1 protein [Bryobacteraceae bacterium]